MSASRPEKSLPAKRASPRLSLLERGIAAEKSSSAWPKEVAPPRVGVDARP
jgi:hypothetical protein